MTQTEQHPDVRFAREKAKRTLPVSLLVLLGIIAMYLPLPKRFIAVLPLVIAVVLTVQLLRFLSGRAGREKIWPAITLGLVGLLLSTLAVQAVFYDEVSAYERCTSEAQTQQARGTCEELRDKGPLGIGFVLE